MPKDEGDIEAKSFEEPPAESESGRGAAIIAVLAVVTIVGLAIWLLANQEES